MSKTILFVASGNWDAGLMASYRRAFVALGYRVVDFDLEAKRLEAGRGPAPIRRVVHRLMGYVDVPSINARANRTLVTAARESPEFYERWNSLLRSIGRAIAERDKGCPYRS